MRFTIVILTALFCLGAGAEGGAAATEGSSDEALIQAAEKLVKEGEAKDKDGVLQAAVPAPGANQATQLKESEIPVQLSALSKPKETSHMMWRLAASFAVLAAIAGVLYFVTRRWTMPKDKSPAGARIEMLHQFHMGPRRSVALIRVAGEAILIGVTDQSINMLKPVTLIDDELEGYVKKDFNNFLEDEFSIEDVRTALRS